MADGGQPAAIGAVRSHALRAEIGHGCEGVKPGWTRVNLNYFISSAAASYIADAVGLIAEDAFPGYLDQARAVLAALPATLDDGPTGLGPDFAALRWFPLPAACLGDEGSVRLADHAEHPQVDLAEAP